MATTAGKRDIMLFSSDGKAVRFDEDSVRSMGRTATGVRGMRLAEGERVVSMVVVEGDGDILTASENGFGKRTTIDEYPKKGRGTQGVIALQTTERNGALVAGVQLDDTHELMLMRAFPGDNRIRRSVDDIANSDITVAVENPFLHGIPRGHRQAAIPENTHIVRRRQLVGVRTIGDREDALVGVTGTAKDGYNLVSEIDIGRNGSI